MKKKHHHRIYVLDFLTLTLLAEEQFLSREQTPEKNHTDSISYGRQNIFAEEGWQIKWGYHRIKLVFSLITTSAVRGDRNDILQTDNGENSSRNAETEDDMT
jgi:hypothetical protein